MVNTKLDIHICGPTSVFHFDPHPYVLSYIADMICGCVFKMRDLSLNLWPNLGGEMN